MGARVKMKGIMLPFVALLTALLSIGGSAGVAFATGGNSGDIHWGKQGSNLADPNCQPGQQATFHFVLSGNGVKITDAGTGTATFEPSGSASIAGTIKGAGGSAHYTVSGEYNSVVTGFVVKGASWTGSAEPFLKLSDSSCSGTPTKPADKVVYGDWTDGKANCDTRKVEQSRTKSVTTYTWDGTKGKWVANTTTTTENRTRDMTADEIKACAGDKPADKVVKTEWVDGDKSCESKTVTQTRTVTTTPYVYNAEQGKWVLGTPVVKTETQTRPMTEAEAKACTVTPPPSDECVSLTGSVKTTDKDGNVVNENTHYANKADVYVSGSQLPNDVSKVYLRVVAPSGTPVLSSVKEVAVSNGSFGPVQLPVFSDTPNQGGEYKVQVSTSPDFEGKCTKSDNFKVKDEVPPPPTKVDVPAAPETVDACNPPGVSDNVAWKNPLPADTNQVDWSESTDGKTRTASLKGENVEWSDGTTAPKVFTLPKDSGVKCEVPPPPTKTCPAGTKWVDHNHNGKVDNGECMTPEQPKPPVKKPPFECPKGMTGSDKNHNGKVDNGECMVVKKTPPTKRGIGANTGLDDTSVVAASGSGIGGANIGIALLVALLASSVLVIMRFRTRPAIATQRGRHRQR